MSLTRIDFSNYIKAFNFRELFNFMGWDNDKTIQPIVVDNETFTLQAVGEKSGFKILLCNPQSNGLLPNYSTRKKIETKVTKLFQEHLIIFFDKNKTEQIWQLVVRQSGKPTKVTETRWRNTQDPELLYQRAAGIFFELDEEDKITIVDVKSRVGQNFHQNNEKITKQFYDTFKKEHRAFLQFIQGISDETNKDWYASLMLNRLMFCYFIQKKGFLDNNKNYLRDKLEASTLRQAQGAKAQKFFSFYRDFLLVLFHKGLNEPTQNWDIKIEIGKIPYLNGGLFDEHELERAYTNIDIEDTAFKQLFDFFDQYEWHLDTSVTATGKDINPDVIGYIFEKYINDRANMGAYYTKEDITDYISKNCILPFLFDETKRNYPKGFNADGDLWQMVKTSGDRYIYDVVKKGVEEPLPIDIEQGINEVSERSEWNKPATNTYALPTEIWREVVDRRNRYTEVKTKIDKGEINAINDFITYNLNIRQFAQDVVENTTDPELLKHFYRALNIVTIIDPTCGSGAFLFAAMNILEPLYESCIQRMENFVAEATKGKYKYFEEVLAQVKSPEHPNLQYFIYKSIILRNLYGVDIMKEAVEIAKLRLFLKLVATVEADYRKPNLGLEPLPDIDFNIRAGNTLVGFATEAELQNGLTYTFDGVIAKPLIEEKCEIVSGAFKRYKEIQLTFGDDFNEFKKAKTALNERLKELNHDLNKLLHKQATAYQYEDWLQSHQPFHWFAEFYEIIKENGGFDVIIGNPPYVEYSEKKFDYIIKGFETEKCSNLYGYVIERSYKIMNENSLIGMIIPISAFSNSSMLTLQKFIKKFPVTYISNFHQRPAALFEGVLQRLSIFISRKKADVKEIKTSIVYRWNVNTRESLFPNVSYVQCDQSKQDNSLKIGYDIEKGILKKYLKHKPISVLVSKSPIPNNAIHYRTAGGGYWVTILNTPFLTTSLSNKSTSFLSEYKSKVISVILNSNLFWWYYTINFDQFNFKDYMIFGFRFDYPNENEIVKKLIKLSDKLEKELLENSTTYIINSKTRGSNETITYNKYLSKVTMDEIDKVLAEHYGFDDDELDFLINYDIKYRMSKEKDVIE
jgi:methylase of polypeptide subunit release factors